MIPSTIILAAKNVIVVNDTAFLRDRFKTALEGAGYRTSMVGNGAKFIARTRGHTGDRRHDERYCSRCGILGGQQDEAKYN